MSIKMQFTTVVLATTLAFAGGAKAAPASTSSPDDGTVSVRVSVADLDLSQKAGLAVAHKRIHRAAALVCGSQSASAGLTVYGLYSDCRKTAFNEAVTDLNAQIASTMGPQSYPKATALAANR